jgi:hypothetical protein
MKCRVLELYPTQLALGLYEVDEKVAHLKKVSSADAERYIREHPVPIVLGPRGRRYLVDHHHLVRACWEVGIGEVVGELRGDLSELDMDRFWARLTELHWSHLYDQFGHGPHPYTNLPSTVRGLGDDPFRSLAWAVREAGGYTKSEEPFCEFQWANYFRKFLGTHPVVDDFEKALQEAMTLTKRPEASNLPGYVG